MQLLIPSKIQEVSNHEHLGTLSLASKQHKSSTAPMFCTSLRRRSSFASIVPFLTAPSGLATKGMLGILEYSRPSLTFEPPRIIAGVA